MTSSSSYLVLGAVGSDDGLHVFLYGGKLRVAPGVLQNGAVLSEEHEALGRLVGILKIGNTFAKERAVKMKTRKKEENDEVEK